MKTVSTIILYVIMYDKCDLYTHLHVSYMYPIYNAVLCLCLTVHCCMYVYVHGTLPLYLFYKGSLSVNSQLLTKFYINFVIVTYCRNS